MGISQFIDIFIPSYVEAYNLILSTNILFIWKDGQVG